MKRFFLFLLFGLAVPAVFASQSYVPPPPPKLPKMLSEEMVAKGKRLFEDNVWKDGPLEIHNYLGTTPCGACHDAKEKLVPKKLAEGFGTIRERINQEIVQKQKGTALPLQDPAMEALVQYMIERYALYEFKLSK